MANRKLILSLSTVLSISLSCSEFNNPIKPTYPVKCYYSLGNIEIAVCSTKVHLQRTGPAEFPEKDVPLAVLYIKTDTDFSKEYPLLNENNSNYIYTVFLDTIIDTTKLNNNSHSIFQYKIVLSSHEKESCDTSYYKSTYYLYFDIILNYNYMNYPKQFLWQARLYQKDTYILPPNPYTFIVPKSIVN